MIPQTGIPLGFSPDSRRLMIETTDNAIRIWDIVDQKEVETIQLPDTALRVRFDGNTAINGKTISEDGRRLAVRLTNSAVHIWDLETRQTNILPEHEQVRRAGSFARTRLAFSRDGRVLAAGDYWPDLGGRASVGIVRMWDLPSLRAGEFSIATRIWDPGLPPALALSPTGNLLATGSTDNGTRLWDLNAQRELLVLSGPRGDALSLAFSPDGKLLAGGFRDHTVWLWEVPSGRRRALLKGRRAVVNWVAFSPDSKTLVSGGSDDLVELWNIAAARSVLTLKAPLGLFSPDGNSFLLAQSYNLLENPLIKLLRPDSLAQIDSEIAGGEKH